MTDNYSSQPIYLCSIIQTNNSMEIQELTKEELELVKGGKWYYINGKWVWHEERSNPPKTNKHNTN